MASRGRSRALVLEIVADSKQFSSDVGKLGATLKSALGAAGLALGAREVFQFLGSSIQAAADLDEAINAVRVSAGAASEGILEIAERGVESFALTQTQVAEAAVAFQGFNDQIGGDAVANFDQLITRATDFGSVLNLDTQEALRIFQSSLAGQTEPIRRFGIDLSAAAVESFALQEGIVGAGQAMSESEKVTARFGLLMQSTSRFAGDFANTSDSVANTQKRIQARVGELQIAIGQQLLPIWGDLLATFEASLPIIEQLAGKLTSALSPLAGIAQIIPDATDSSRSLNDRARDIAATFTDVGLTLTGFGIIFKDSVVENIRGADDEIQTVIPEWYQLFTGTLAQGVADAASSASGDVQSIADATGDAYRDTNDYIGDWVRILDDLAGAYERAAARAAASDFLARTDPGDVGPSDIDPSTGLPYSVGSGTSSGPNVSVSGFVGAPEDLARSIEDLLVGQGAG